MSQKNLMCNYKYVSSIVCQSVIALRQTTMVNEQLVTVDSLFYEYLISLVYCFASIHENIKSQTPISHCVS